MEHRTRKSSLLPVLEVPPEVWCHILHYVDEFDDIFILRRVNRLFNDELKKKKVHPLAFLKEVNVQGIKYVHNNINIRN